MIQGKKRIVVPGSALKSGYHEANKRRGIEAFVQDDCEWK